MLLHVKVIDVSSMTDVVGVFGGAENKLKQNVEMVWWGLISNYIYY